MCVCERIYFGVTKSCGLLSMARLVGAAQFHNKNKILNPYKKPKKSFRESVKINGGPTRSETFADYTMDCQQTLVAAAVTRAAVECGMLFCFWFDCL